MNTTNVCATADRAASAAEDEKYLNDFFNSAELNEHRAVYKEVKRTTLFGKLKDTFHRESIPDSVAALRKRDYPISKGQIFRAHKAPANATGNMDVLRNNAWGAADSVDDYIAHVIRHTAGSGSAGSILSFSANKKVSKKFMGADKVLLGIDIDALPPHVRPYVMTTPQLIIKHAGSLLRQERITSLELISALDQLNNKEEEVFFVGQLGHLQIGELPKECVFSVKSSAGKFIYRREPSAPKTRVGPSPLPTPCNPAVNAFSFNDSRSCDSNLSMPEAAKDLAIRPDSTFHASIPGDEEVARLCQLFDEHYGRQKNVDGLPFSAAVEHITMLEQRVQANPLEWFDTLEKGGLFKKETGAAYARYISVISPATTNDAIRVAASVALAPLHFFVAATLRALNDGKLSCETAIGLVYQPLMDQVSAAGALAPYRSLIQAHALAELVFVTLPVQILRSAHPGTDKEVHALLLTAFNQAPSSAPSLAEQLDAPPVFGVPDGKITLKQRMKQDVGLQLSSLFGVGKAKLKFTGLGAGNHASPTQPDGLVLTPVTTFYDLFHKHVPQMLARVDNVLAQDRRSAKAMREADIVIQRKKQEDQIKKNRFYHETHELTKNAVVADSRSYQKSLRTRSAEERQRQNLLAADQAEKQAKYEYGRLQPIAVATAVNEVTITRSGQKIVSGAITKVPSSAAGTCAEVATQPHLLAAASSCSSRFKPIEPAEVDAEILKMRDLLGLSPDVATRGTLGTALLPYSDGQLLALADKAINKS